MSLTSPRTSMPGRLSRPLLDYAHWLHTGFPGGSVEPLPVLDSALRCAPDIYVAGDLTGIPLLKHALDSGVRAVRHLSDDPELTRKRQRRPERLDLVILGAGVAGLAAAVEARTLGLSVEVVEANAPLSTLQDFPKGKPILAYPLDFTPAGALQLGGKTKETLLEVLRQQLEARPVPLRQARALSVRRRDGGVSVELEGQPELSAHSALIAIGKTGNSRLLDVPGEELEKVQHRLLDPSVHTLQDVVVAGGGDAAVEAALALVQAGARVTLSVRASRLTRPKPRLLEQLEQARASGLPLRVLTSTVVSHIEQDWVVLQGPQGEQRIPNNALFALIGREPPAAFFRRSGLPLRGERSWKDWAMLTFILCLSFFVYHWKAGGSVTDYFKHHNLFPFNIKTLFDFEMSSGDQGHSLFQSLLTTLRYSLEEPGFYYSALYTLTVLTMGLRRIRLKGSPYVTRQTLSLMAVQLIPLFFLPYLLLPWLGHAGVFDTGLLRQVADALFPVVAYGQGREYWRAFGLVLAWPLFIWNVFSQQPLWAWLAISVIQTGVLIPLLVKKWGKGAYCGWLCSCGALAETLGDGHRHKMPHGPGWNRLNMAGQVLLGLAFFLLALRVASWLFPGGRLESLFWGMLSGWQVGPLPISWYWVVDVTLAGMLGVGLYWHFSGRVWCRFFCPLAAWMHVLARFSQFRIRADKARCISCGLCTATCHQGIDVMAFASAGKPLDDPQCVRCSACVASCPTGVLALGTLDPVSGQVIPDSLDARSFRV